MKDVERAFRAWLDLSRDEEVLFLFDLVQSALRRRGYSVTCEVRALEKEKPE